MLPDHAASATEIEAAPMIDTLPEVMLAYIAQLVLFDSLPSALRFGQACKSLQRRLEPVRRQAAARRVRWVPELTASAAISDDGRSLTKLGPPLGRGEFGWADCWTDGWVDDWADGWAAGELLPTTTTAAEAAAAQCAAAKAQLAALQALASAWTVGESSMTRSNGGRPPSSAAAAPARADFCEWSVRIERSHQNDGAMYVGVCDAECTCAWGLWLSYGKRVLTFQHGARRSPPAGYPSVEYHDAVVCEKLAGYAEGAVVGVVLEGGNLSFRVNDGPVVVAVSGFPRGAPLRPWAKMYYAGDTVRFSRAYVDFKS